MMAIQILTYVCAAIFVAFCVARAVRYARTPLHLRWELYPVAHEKGRAEYGGSIFEELDWWTKPREIDRLNEASEMFKEIVLLKGVRRNNPGLWRFSFPFHFGLYMVIVWLALLVVLGILAAAGVTLGPALSRATELVLAVTGYGGLLLTGIGALGLLVRRLGDAEQRRYSAPVEFLNLAFFLVVVVVALYVQATTDPWFRGLGAFFASLAAFRPPASPVSAGLQLHVALGALLMAYIPLTRMSHFVAKYFLYHDVRWSDDPNPRGSAIEGRVKNAFGYRMHWTAPHIQTGRSWGEVGTTSPEQDAGEPRREEAKS
ncbi:MAG: respiratory nitrate reductase subunit gamma [Candidatus Eiseniibacteriota bacterium]|jgi:nitrate reductase gamma subunit